MVNRQKFLTDRQSEILSTLAIKGQQNKSHLSLEYKIKYPAIVGTMKILKDKDLVRITKKKEKGVGKPRVFYEITDKGLEILSKYDKLSLEKFWEIAFLVYGNVTKNVTKLKADVFFSNYEKYVLGHDLEYGRLPPSFILFDNIIFARPIKPSIYTVILRILAVHGNMSEDKIVLKILNSNDPHLSISPPKNEIIKQLQNMVVYDLVLIVGKKAKYRISSLGMLILFHHLIDWQMERNKLGSYGDPESILQKIVKISQTVIPKVFSYWNDLLKIESPANLLRCFDRIGEANRSNFPSFPIQNGGIAEIFLMEKMLIKSNSTNITAECVVGIRTLENLVAEKRYQKDPSSEAMLRLSYLSVLVDRDRKNESHILEKVTKKKNYSFAEEADKSLASIISFEFYLYLVEMIRITLPITYKVDSIFDREKLLPYMRQRIDEWNNFASKNVEVREWHKSWMKHIIEFEMKNIKILNDKLKSSQSLTI